MTAAVARPCSVPNRSTNLASHAQRCRPPSILTSARAGAPAITTGRADDRVDGALQRLANAYALAADAGNGALFAGQFTADGVLLAPRGRFEGHRQLARVPALLRERYDWTFHAVLNQMAEVDGRTAWAQTALQEF